MSGHKRVGYVYETEAERTPPSLDDTLKAGYTARGKAVVIWAMLR